MLVISACSLGERKKTHENEKNNNKEVCNHRFKNGYSCFSLLISDDLEGFDLQIFRVWPPVTAEKRET